MKNPRFTADELLTEARILDAAATLMDGRMAQAKCYRKWAQMLRQVHDQQFENQAASGEHHE